MPDQAYVRTLHDYQESIREGTPFREGIIDAFIENGFFGAAVAFSDGKLADELAMQTLKLCIQIAEAVA